VVKVVQVDGKTNNRGMSLDAFVQMLLDMGFVNAVNLDGGGSATSVINGSVVSASAEDACPERQEQFCPECKGLGF
jgi:exopolysaccharide biosynthesis protein